MIERLRRLHHLLHRLQMTRDTLLRAIEMMGDFNHERAETLARMGKILQNQIDYAQDEIRKMEER